MVRATMITSKLVLIPMLVLALAACDKKASKTQVAPPPAPSVAADGTRSISIQVRKAGYVPDKIAVKPGEKFRLVFTRVEDTQCGAQVQVADGKLLDLPMNTPVEVVMTAPASGEVRFACGMDMMTGVVIVDAADHI